MNVLIYDETLKQWIINRPLNEGDIIEKYNNEAEIWERYRVMRDHKGNWHLPNGELFHASWIVRHP